MSSPSPRSKKSRSRRDRDMDYQESKVSQTKRVQNAVREARKSSREKGKQRKDRPPTTPRGLVIQTSPEKNSIMSPQSLDMNSPSMSDAHMHTLLAPTYDSRDNGSSIGGASSVNTSEDIIRKVELEIATARKAATEAQSRLADALSKSWELQHHYSSMSDTNHDPLDDLDIPLRDILSISSAEASPEGGAKPALSENDVPKMVLDDTDEQSVDKEKESAALKTIESAVSHDSDEGSNAAKTDLTDPTDSPTATSSNGSTASPVLRYTGTQQTFESGVELGLEDVEATLGRPGINMNVLDHDDDDDDDYASATPRSETLPDEFSDYTEETVSEDYEEGDDDRSEYTEETVHSEEEEELAVDRVPAPSNTNTSEDRSTSQNDEPDESTGNEKEPDAASPKPWIVGSRDMHKSPKEVKPWWSGGWWPDEQTAKKEGTSPQNAKRPPDEDAKTTDPKQEEDTMPSYKESLGSPPSVEGERENRSSKQPSETAKSPSSAASESENEARASPDKAYNDVGEVKDENEEKILTSEKESSDAAEDATVLKDVSPKTNEIKHEIATEPQKLESKVSSERVKFREAYPVPPQVPKPRPAPDIIADNTTGIPRRVTRWSKPKPELDDLLAAVKGDSLARRSNAVGALKILLTREAKNQIILVRTTGFLEALVFACREEIQASPEMETAIIARTRAVTTIMKVSEPKENRVVVITEPGLPECLVKVIKEDTGEARAHACAALAMLAKTPMNKEYIVKVDDLVNVLSLVVNGTIDPKMGPAGQTSNDGDGAPALSFDEEGTCASSIHEGSIGEILYSSDSIRKQKDEKKSEFELQAKVNACAVLMHLSKHCSISSILATNLTFMGSMMTVARDFESPLNTKCVEILCNLTRFHANTSAMARNDVLVETLVKCGKSKVVDDRVWALRAFQNISADSSSKVILATGKILTLLSICAMRQEDEQEAAVATIYNLSTEPSAVVPITNTRNVVATLVHLAHNPKVSDKVQRMSCEALATIGLWLQTLAGSGTVPAGAPKSLLPTHKTVGWQRWA